MSKIGVIFSAYQTKEYVKASLNGWIGLRNLMGKENVLVCAVSVRFAGFEGEDDGTREVLREALSLGLIDHLIEDPQNIPETTARGMGLTWLKAQGADIIIQWDADEVATPEELAFITFYVNDNPWADWYRISYRNLVFTTNQWLADPFTPPRIHRVRTKGLEAHSFSGDNDIQYVNLATGAFVSQETLPSQIVYESVAFPRHYTWLNDERSRQKVAYQQRRWGHCSFSWDDAQGGLIFNPAFPRPKVVREST